MDGESKEVLLYLRLIIDASGYSILSSIFSWIYFYIIINLIVIIVG